MADYCGFTDDGAMLECYDAYLLEGGDLSVFWWMYYWLPEHSDIATIRVTEQVSVTFELTPKEAQRAQIALFSVPIWESDE